MHVAYLCADPGVPVFGSKGSSVHVQEIVRAWQHAGASVKVYCTSLGNDRPEDLEGLDIVQEKLAAAHGSAREEAAAVAADLLAQRVASEGCDLIYERYSLFSTALETVKRRLAVPGVLEVNAPLIDEQQRHRQLWDVGRSEAVFRCNAGRADVVACVSLPVMSWVRARAPQAKTLLTPNGVNVNRIAPRPTGRGSSDRLTVAFVGTLKPWHGLPGLIEAVALANARPEAQPQWSVRIIGDGPMRPVLEALAQKLQVATEFTGAVPPDSVPGLLSDCDAAAAPYPVPEAGHEDYFSPLKVYEYMAAAMPIIATSTGQIPSIINHGSTGILVPAGVPAAFADALIALARDPALSLRLGQSARAEAVKRFSWEGVLSKITAALPPTGTVAVL